MVNLVYSVVSIFACSICFVFSSSVYYKLSNLNFSSLILVFPFTILFLVPHLPFFFFQCFFNLRQNATFSFTFCLILNEFWLSQLNKTVPKVFFWINFSLFLSPNQQHEDLLHSPKNQHPSNRVLTQSRTRF